MENSIETVTGPPWRGVQYFTTTRAGGCSEGSWAGLNLGQHCGDSPAHVSANRQQLAQSLPSLPHWMQQIHSTNIYQALRPTAKPYSYEQSPMADAAFTTTPNTVIAVLTADCLPVVIADAAGTIVGVAHAGWRGLAAGVIEKLFLEMQKNRVNNDQNTQWHAWIGPAISQKHFEVGQDVFDVFTENNKQAATYFKVIQKQDKYLADLSGLAEKQLRNLAGDFICIEQSGACTYTEKNRYYSYRRQASTGRMVTLAWLE